MFGVADVRGLLRDRPRRRVPDEHRRPPDEPHSPAPPAPQVRLLLDRPRPDPDRLHRPPRRRLASRRQGHPDRLARLGRRRVRDHAPGVHLRPDQADRLGRLQGDGPLRLARDHRGERLLRHEPRRPVHRQGLPRGGGDRPLRRRLPLQPGRPRRRARLPDGLDALALPVAEERPSPADGLARRDLLLLRDRIPLRPRRGVDPARLPPAHARALLAGNAHRRAPLPRRGGDRRVHRSSRPAST